MILWTGVLNMIRKWKNSKKLVTWMWTDHEAFIMSRCNHHRTTGTTCSAIQRQPISYVDDKKEQKKSVNMKKLHGKDNDNDLWVKMPSPDTEISQRPNFNEYELVQDEYLKNLGTTEKLEQTYRQDRLGNNDNGQLSHLYQETKTDKMQNWEGK